jgi:endonuclease YncB( thermonuclease family)
MLWTYKAAIDRVIDGDTVDVLSDLGFGVSYKIRLRLARIDAPEVDTPEGKRVKQLMIDALPKGTACIISTAKGDKYGRRVAELTVGQSNINDWLLDAGLAKLYEGAK